MDKNKSPKGARKKMAQKRDRWKRMSESDDEYFTESYSENYMPGLRGYFDRFKNENIDSDSKEAQYLRLAITAILIVKAQEAIEHSSDIAFIKELTQHRLADINAKNRYGNAPIHAAVFNKNIPLLKCLLSVEGIDVNLLDGDGLAPIHRAIMHNDAKVLSILLAKEGIDVNILGKHGLAPIHRAIMINRAELLPILVAKKGIGFNILDKKGLPLIRYLVRWYNPKVWELVMENSKNKLDINATDPYGCTALHYALYYAGNPAKVSMEAVYKLLDRKDIDVNAVTNAGYTPLHTLISNKNFNEALFRRLTNDEKLKVDFYSKIDIKPYAFASIVGNKNAMKILEEDPRFSTELLPIYIKWYAWMQKIKQVKRSIPDDLEGFSDFFQKLAKKILSAGKKGRSSSQ